MVEVDTDKQPAEGEVLVFTVSGGFLVKGSMSEVAERLAAEDWAHFELAESEDRVIIRSTQVIALRGGSRAAKKGHIGFAPRA